MLKGIAGLLLIGLVCGCMSSKQQEPVQPQPLISGNPRLAPCNNRTTVVNRENCYVDVAVSTNTEALCDEVSTDSLRNLCYHKIAVNVQNPYICQRIKKDDWRYTDCIQGSTSIT